MAPRYWLDSSCLIEPAKKFYPLNMFPQVWAFLAEEAKQGTIGSPQICLDDEFDLPQWKSDPLRIWAVQLAADLFYPPDQEIQRCYATVTSAVSQNPQHAPQHLSSFLSKADPWVIAYALQAKGTIVTLEQSVPSNSTKVKIPNVAATFGIPCMNLLDLLTDLQFRA